VDIRRFSRLLGLAALTYQVITTLFQAEVNREISSVNIGWQYEMGFQHVGLLMFISAYDLTSICSDATC